MARSAAGDRQFLEQKNGKWRVSIAVPRHLHKRLGTRLKRSLQTDSLTAANALKWGVVAELRQVITHALSDDPKGSVMQEALAFAALREKAATEDEHDDADFAIDHRGDELRGEPIGVLTDTLTGREVPYYDPERERRGGQFLAIAKGLAVPLDAHHGQYLAQLKVKPRTRADDERALRYLQAWCHRENLPPTVNSISRKVAVRFMDQLGSIAGGQSPVTLQKYMNRLSRYWQWMLTREHVEANVWHGLHYPADKVPHDELERPFSDVELLKLLNGNATQAMHDLMRIAALTGARLDVIVDLRVGDCASGVFFFKPQKKEAKPRAVPIHPDLAEIVSRRTEGRLDSADVFPEWPAPKKVDTQRERSFKASNAFTTYRRAVGVEELVVGKRRSLVNFHSFRRWFITMAERADQPENIIATVVGHKRQGMTLGRYSGGPLLEQARRCVEAVRLPVESRAVTQGAP